MAQAQVVTEAARATAVAPRHMRLALHGRMIKSTTVATIAMAWLAVSWD